MALREMPDIGTAQPLHRNRATQMSRRRLLTGLAAAVVLVATGSAWLFLRDTPTLGGRSNGDPTAAPVAAATSPSTSTDLIQVGPTAIDPSKGIPSAHSSPTVVPAAPGSVAGIAQSSIPLVVQLHDVAAIANRDTGLPKGAVRVQATDLVRGFQVTLKALHQYENADRRLTTAITKYVAIAKALTKTTAPPAATLTTQLQAADTPWTAVLEGIKGTDGKPLRSRVPVLLYPTEPAPSPPSLPIVPPVNN